MSAKITVILPEITLKESSELKKEISTNQLIDKVISYGSNQLLNFKNVEFKQINTINSTKNFQLIFNNIPSKYILYIKDETQIKLSQFAIERFLQIAENTDAGMVYSDYYQQTEQELKAHPVIEYQQGSLRDDFNFGSMILFKTEAVKNSLKKFTQSFDFAAFYYLRLKLSQNYELFKMSEFLYTVSELDSRKSGQKIFDYVDPKNRKVQIEMEQAATEHLKDINAYLKPIFTDMNFTENHFETTASVIIPVRNRVKTIKDAIESVLSQKTDFNYNIIVVDNYSNDGTSELIKDFAAKNDNIIHLTPDRKDLGIGGCWNAGVHHNKCGMFAIQLDSDDIYKDENTLQKIVNAFYEQKCGMVVGTYQLVNFELDEIPPGIIDHKEWTADNGRNNALRINGLGAPRAFFTPLIRKIKVPNVSYGEDYALGLAISRNYQIGRIYDSLYLCRRWDDNSDAALDIEKMNKHNLYKDKIRTIELKARQIKNSKQ